MAPSLKISVIRCLSRRTNSYYSHNSTRWKCTFVCTFFCRFTWNSFEISVQHLDENLASEIPSARNIFLRNMRLKVNHNRGLMASWYTSELLAYRHLVIIILTNIIIIYYHGQLHEENVWISSPLTLEQHSAIMLSVNFKVHGFSNFFYRGQRLKEVFKTWGSCSMSWNAEGGL